MKTKVKTCLWFDGKAEEAARFYVSLLAGSSVGHVFRNPADDAVLTVEFVLAGTPYQGLNGGPHFRFTEAASISVLTEDQAETDRLWSALLANGGEESRCGWLKDRFGLSWQIVPEALPRLLGGDDRARAGRAFTAMMTMRKIDVAAIEAACRGG